MSVANIDRPLFSGDLLAMTEASLKRKAVLDSLYVCDAAKEDRDRIRSLETARCIAKLLEISACDARWYVDVPPLERGDILERALNIVADEDPDLRAEKVSDVWHVSWYHVRDVFEPLKKGGLFSVRLGEISRATERLRAERGIVDSVDEIQLHTVAKCIELVAITGVTSYPINAKHLMHFITFTPKLIRSLEKADPNLSIRRVAKKQWFGLRKDKIIVVCDWSGDTERSTEDSPLLNDHVQV